MDKVVCKCGRAHKVVRHNVVVKRLVCKCGEVVEY